MKIQTSLLTSAPVKSDLVIFVRTAAGLKNINRDSSPLKLPSNLKICIEQSLVLDNFTDEKSKISLFQFPETQISRLLICTLDNSADRLNEAIRKIAGKAYSNLSGQKIAACHLIVDVENIEKDKVFERRRMLYGERFYSGRRKSHKRVLRNLCPGAGPGVG
jgi:hypothetical protein